MNVAQRPLRMTTPAEVRAALVKIANECRSGKLSPAVTNALVCACNSILSSLRMDVQEKKIAELEAILQECESSERP